MIDLALLRVIRHWHLREKVSIRENERRTKLLRNTINKCLASGEVSPFYPARKSPTQLAPYVTDLSRWLQVNQQLPRKQRRTI